ncbi:MAG: hypothetical protein IKB93_09720, partial [Clostridia bacterium]|nr:hypothetical protein [Clostridia bacterium]
MKIFKKAISLVLVFAMLASFAGMTGYRYSPASIIANAVDPKVSSNRPVDSKAGTNTVTIDMPPVLYKNSSGTIVNSVNGTTLDTVLNFTLPGNTTSATVKAVSLSSDSTVIKTWSFTGGGAKTVDFNNENGNTLTEGATYMILRLDYKVTVANTPYDTPRNSIVDTNKNEIVNTDYDNDGDVDAPFLDVNIYGDYPDVSVADTVEVTYTQYIACYVESIPVLRVGWQGDLKRRRGITSSEKKKNNTVLSEYQYMDLSGLLGNGTNIYGTFKNNGNGTTPSTSMSGLSGLFYQWGTNEQADGSSARGYWTGTSRALGSSPTSYATFGAKIYYDISVSPTRTFTLTHQFTSTSHSDPKYTNAIEAYYAKINSNVNSQTHEYNGSEWSTAGSSTTGYSADTSGDSANEDYVSYNNANAIWQSGGNEPSGDINNGDTSTKKTATYTIDLNNAYFDSKVYSQLVTQLNTDENSDGWYPVRACFVTGYHIDVFPVDRSTEHKVIEEAISKNFIEAEMDASWWSAYRTEVLYAYYLCGALGNDNGVKALFDNLMTDGKQTDNANLRFKVANYSELANAIINTPDYDRGNAAMTSATANPYIIQPGQAYLDLIGYNTTDPQNGVYGNYAGNGVNNLAEYSIYRYSGAYFYTEESWLNYAKERYYADNIFEYYNETVPYQTFWYGSAPNPNKTPNALYCYIQPTVDAATQRLLDARAALELRTLGGLKMRNDYNDNGRFVKDSSGNQVIGYDAIIAYLEAKIPTDKITYYSGLSEDGSQLVETEMLKYDTSTLITKLNDIKANYKAADTVVDKGIAFEAAIADFLKEVDNVLTNKKNRTQFTGWNALFTQLSKMAGGETINATNILDKFQLIYVDDTDKTTYNAINAQVKAYELYAETNNTFAGDTSEINSGMNNQDVLDSYVLGLYNVLMGQLPSKQVVDAATEVKDYPATQTFKVYNYENMGKTLPDEVCKFTTDSISALKTAANDAAAVKYTMLTTPLADLTAAATAVSNLKNLKTDTPAGVLEYVAPVTKYLDTAVSFARGELYAADGVYKTTPVTNPAGTQTVNVNLYSADSIAQLEYVLNEAAQIKTNVSNGTITWSNQIEIDKITFALYEETSDDTPFLLGDAVGSDVAYAYRNWAASNNMVWTTTKWDTYLYSERSQAYMGSSGYGLQPGPAYYGFLEAEIKGNTIIKTVTNEETGETTT